jgi:hypothetical protein
VPEERVHASALDALDDPGRLRSSACVHVPHRALRGGNVPSVERLIPPRHRYSGSHVQFSEQCLRLA